jgi:hypothetical protein
MTKIEWQAHARAAGEHDRTTCTECAKRRRTQRASRRARERDAAMRDLGLTKVRDAVGGILWE